MNTKPLKCVVLLSGGLDSLACAQYYINKKHSVSALFVNYGQRAAEQEYSAAKSIALSLEIELDTLTINLGQNYDTGEIFGRNLLLVSLSLASGILNKGILVIGIHSSTDYYDCSHSFYQHLQNLIIEMSKGRINLIAPFIDFPRSKIIEFLRENNAPISTTYSCEQGDKVPCGLCLSCNDRILLECP